MTETYWEIFIKTDSLDVNYVEDIPVFPQWELRMRALKEAMGQNFQVIEKYKMKSIGYTDITLIVPTEKEARMVIDLLNEANVIGTQYKKLKGNKT